MVQAYLLSQIHTDIEFIAEKQPNGSLVICSKVYRGNQHILKKHIVQL